jgi:FlaA1/EpsC-like NDP-sugar epimerase
MYTFILKQRMIVIFFIQVVIIAASLVFAYALRFEYNIPPTYQQKFWEILPVFIALKMVIFWKIGLFNGWWRYVSMHDLILIFKANVLASLCLVLYVVYVYRLENISRTVLTLDFVFCFLFMGGVRFITRAFRENYFPMPLSRRQVRQRALIVGAGDAGQMIVKEIRQNPKLQLDVIGFVDDDANKKGQRFQGIQVLGVQEELSTVCLTHGVDEVIIAIPSASGPQIRSIIERCQSLGVKFKTLPGVGDLIDGKVTVQHIRDVNLEDLLGRKPIHLDNRGIANYLKGKRVLVTGAGGSIGSELCRQIAKFRPEKLVLFENSETPLFLIEQELSISFPDIHVVPIIGDIRNPSRIKVIFDEQMPQVVFHAAAYKHVPMMELNPAEAINNNVRGTVLLADAADKFAVETFVMISTDKAVRPTNVMGASKRVAELYVQSLTRSSKTRYVTTRFGNVLGSNGSVIPTFKEQIKKGGPVTVTHPEVTRFFMTIPEASQLVLQAGSMGQGGEIYLFDMGEPVKIVALAEELIRLSGMVPHTDIEIVYSGLRPGEKLYEELLLDDEGVLPTQHEKICVASAAFPSRDDLIRKLVVLIAAAKNLDLPGVRAGLQDIVPEYTPVVHRQKAKVIPHPSSVVHQ